MAFGLISGGNLGFQSIAALTNVLAASTTCHQSRIPTILFPNVAGNAIFIGYQHVSGGNITIRAALELADGSKYRCKVTTGVYAKTMVADSTGTLYMFEVEGLTSIPTIQLGYIHTKVDFATGAAPLYNVRLKSLEVSAQGVWGNDVNSAGNTNPLIPSSTDMTLVGATWHIVQNFDTTAFTGVGVFSERPVGSRPAGILAEDSWGDVSLSKFRGAIALELINEATGPGALPHILAMVNGSTAATFNTDLRFRAANDYIDWLLMMRIINDLGTAVGTEQTNLENAFLGIVATWKTGKNIRVYFGTCGPRTLDATAIPTDQFTTEAAQTAYNTNYNVTTGGLRKTINDRILAKYYGNTGSFDRGALLGGTNPYKWRLLPSGARSTADGTHPVDETNTVVIRPAFNKLLLYPTDLTPPTATTAINTGGTVITYTFDEDMDTTVPVTGLSISYNGVAGVALLGGAWADARTLLGMLPDAVLPSTVATWNFDPNTGSIRDKAVPPNKMATVTNGNITNGSTLKSGGSRRRPTRGRG